MFDFDDEEEQVDPEQQAREAAESLEDSDWKARFGACRILESTGAAAAPHVKLIARVAAKDKEADVRKAAQGVLSALRKLGVEIPPAEDDEEAVRAEKKKQREEAWAERRKQREKEWEEKKKMLDAQDRLEEERRRKEDQALYQQYEYYYPEEPSQPSAGADSAVPGGFHGAAASVPSATPGGPPTAFGPSSAGTSGGSAYRPGRTRGSAFSSFRPSPRPAHAPPNANPVLHPAFAPPQEDQEFEIEPEDDFEEREEEERSKRLKELEEKQEKQDEKMRLKAEQANKVPEIVPWQGLRANFRIHSEVLPMRVEHEKMTPFELTEIWEKQWGVPYASHVKFEAPGESARKFLHPREEVVPLHPAVVILHDKAGSVLNSLATALREYGSLQPDEAQALRVHKLEQSLAKAENRQKAMARERERIHIKETRARAKNGTYQDKQDARVQAMRGIVNTALGIRDMDAKPGDRPQRQMRELKRPDLP